MATYDTTFDIDAPIAQVWSALTDFPRYGDWNTFLPSLTGEPRVGSTLAIALVLGEGVKPMNVGAKILTLDQEHCCTWHGNLGADFRVFAISCSRVFASSPWSPSDRTRPRCDTWSRSPV